MANKFVQQMGKDLHAYSNHSIAFDNKDYFDLIQEIDKKLNALNFENPDPLWNEKSKWKVTDYYDYIKDKRFEFEGPFHLYLVFDKSRIRIGTGGYRYYDWFKPENKIERDGWRKYMLAILKTFGGDRVIYLADNGDYLERFTYPDFEGTLDEIEIILKNDEDYGNPITNFNEINMDNLYDDWYFVDYFDDLKT